MGFKIIKTLTLSKSLSAGFIYGWGCQGLLNQSAWLCPTKSKANEKKKQPTNTATESATKPVSLV